MSRLRPLFPNPFKIWRDIKHIGDYPFGNVPHPDDINDLQDEEIVAMKIPETEKQILQSPLSEPRLTSMAKRNSGSGTKTQRKLTMYRPRTPGICKKGYFYDSKKRMCVRAK